MKYFIDVPGYENQLLTRSDCLQLINSGEITPETQMCAHDLQVWMAAHCFFSFPQPGKQVKTEEKPQESTPDDDNMTALLLKIVAVADFIGCVIICLANSYPGGMILAILAGSAISALILIALAEIHSYTRKLALKSR